MADYWGAAAIGSRMNVNESTIAIWIRDQGFLAYKRRRKWYKPAWYTNDDLIRVWEISRAQLDARAARDRKAESQRRHRSQVKA